jgi:putative hemolysin
MTLYLIVIFLFCIIASSFFSGYETGFVSSNLIRIRHLAEKEHNSAAQQLTTHHDNPNRLITMLLIGNNLALVVGTTALTHAVGSGYATLVSLPLYLILGEIMPKSIFRQFPTRFVLLFFPIFRFLEVLMAPITIPVAWLSQRVLNLVKKDAQKLGALLSSLDDMRVLLDESHDQGTLDRDEHEMIHSVIDLQTQSAKEIMVPRIQIQALPETATRHELTSLFIESGRTRIPIYSDSIDQIIGVVNAFDLIMDSHPERKDIQRFIKPVIHVPDSMKLDDVLNTLRDAHQSMAIVTDEHGGTDGLITVEDILEEIFGEIHDEYDIAATQVRKVGPRAYVIDAQTQLYDLSRVVVLDFKDLDVETVGGWVNVLAGHIPVTGEVINAEGLRITVLEGTSTHVISIRLEMLDIDVPQSAVSPSDSTIDSRPKENK